MKTLKQLMSAVALSILASTAVAQTIETTPNQITSGTNHTWTGVSTGSYSVACPPGGGACSGGPGALYDPSTNTIHFSYGQSTAAQTFAINQALSNAGTGIQVQGYNYTWDINNNNGGRTDQAGVDTLTARVITFDQSGTIRRNDSWTYNTKFDWTTFSGTVNYAVPGPTSDFGNLRVEFTGSDSGFWGGYFGPQVRNVGLSLNYTVDQCSVNPQSSPSCPGYKTYYTMGDDGYSIIPLPFGYPFYGRTFTHSIMFDNGVVSFYDPLTEAARLGGQQFYSSPLSNNIGSQFHYSIMPLWTDLAPDSNSRYYTQTDNTNFFKYTWENLPQWGHSDRRNTFGLEIRPTGYLGIQYNQINIEGYPVTAGVVGNATLGEWTQHFRSEGTAVTTGGISNWSLNITQPTDCSNALSNPACPGYAEAFLQQQCTINVLYSPSCPGYADAYFTQQCTANPLYNVNCPGYASAYLSYQCSQDSLYSTTCPGYEQAYFNQQCTANPLYNSGCTGYQQAYFDQQCGLNGLYSTQCPNYADAYYVQQCTISPLYDSGCTGYQQAYFDQQCSIDGLYSTSCPNYATAYFNQQCTANPLYNSSCPGYETAYFNQQCSLNTLYNSQCSGYNEAFFAQQCSIDGLYSNQCPNYAEAYAKKNVLNIGSASPTSPTTTTTVETVAMISVGSDPVAVAAPIVADPVVNQAITTTATSASPAQSATATVPLAPAPAPVAAVVAKVEEKKEEAKAETSTKESTSTTTASNSSDNKDQPKTTRQALAERRLEAARAKAIEDGKQLAGKMGEAASMEAQIQVQGVVMAAMGFVPGFDNYNRATLPDVVGYRPFEIYKGQRNIDNPAGRRFLTGADAKHQEMVDQQYAR